MTEITLRDRPTFKLAHFYRCHGLVERDNFLAFEKTFGEIINTLSTIPDNELWNYVRSLFAYDDYADCVPINAANLSILFHPVQVFLNGIGMDWNRDISIQKRIKPFVHTIQSARELIAKQLNVESKLVAFMRNGSDPNAVISNGLHFAKGDEVLVWSENHPTGGVEAWEIRKQRFKKINIEVVDLDSETDPLDHYKIVKKFLDKVKDNTRLVVFSEISYLTGTHLPAKMLCQEIHSKNPKIHVHVDGAQSWGALNHDLKDMGCDSYSGGSHKWFLGPKETGILYMKEERIPNFAPKDIGYNGEMQPPPPADQLPLDASRFEMVGQRNDTNLIGLLYTADLMDLIGYDKIEDRIKALSTRLRKNLESLRSRLPKKQKFKIETPEDMFHGIMVIQWPWPKEEDKREKPPLSEQVYNGLYENHKIGVSIKKENRMRFSPHIYNTEEQMDRVVAAMEEELKKLRAK